MTFTIFQKTGEVHFDHDGFDDYDGDTGGYKEITVPDEEVHDAVVAMIYEEYFDESVSSICRIGYYSTSRDKMKEQIKQLIDDLDAWDYAVDMYADALREKYEGEYNRG